MVRAPLYTACVLGVLLSALPLHAQQSSGDMFEGMPNNPPPQPDMFPSQTAPAPANDLFHSPPPDAPRDMFRGQPVAPANDVFDQTQRTPNPGIEQEFSAHGAPPTPSAPLYHNPNAPGP